MSKVGKQLKPLAYDPFARQQSFEYQLAKFNKKPSGAAAAGSYTYPAKLASMKPPTRYVKTLTRPSPQAELKAVDTINPNMDTTTITQEAFPFNATASIVCVNNMPKETVAWGRIGRQVTMKNVRVQGTIVGTGNNANPTVGIQFMRLALVYDKQPNGTLPSIDSIFSSQINTVLDTQVTNVFSQPNLNQSARYEIIRDFRIAMPTVNTAAAPNAAQGLLTATSSPMEIDIFIGLSNRIIEFKSDSLTPLPDPNPTGIRARPLFANISTGALYLITWGSIASGSESWSMQLTTRVRYTDQ